MILRHQSQERGGNHQRAASGMGSQGLTSMIFSHTSENGFLSICPIFDFAGGMPRAWKVLPCWLLPAIYLLLLSAYLPARAQGLLGATTRRGTSQGKGATVGLCASTDEMVSRTRRAASFNATVLCLAKARSGAPGLPGLLVLCAAGADVGGETGRLQSLAGAPLMRTPFTLLRGFVRGLTRDGGFCEG